MPVDELGTMLETTLYCGGDPTALEDYLELYLNPENMSTDSLPSLATARRRPGERSPWTGAAEMAHG